MQRLKNGKRRQVSHRKRASFGGSALDDQPGTSLPCAG